MIQSKTVVNMCCSVCNVSISLKLNCVVSVPHVFLMCLLQP